MAHSKKSRKVGQIGVPKIKSSRPVKTRPDKSEGKSKKTSGNKSGTRQQLHTEQSHHKKSVKKDEKHGSKKPIDLNKYKTSNEKNDAQVEDENQFPPILKYKTPQEELDAIESNQTLDDLLDKQSSTRLTPAEQAYVDQLTTRYADLCELLGISVEDDEQIEDEEFDESALNDDPYAHLDAIKTDDFKD